MQYAPRLFRHLKVVVDARRARNGQFLLTGSQKFTLMKSVSESLAGRADITELETLSFAEIHSARPATTVETTIVRGGLPELHANPDIVVNAYLLYSRTERGLRKPENSNRKVIDFRHLPMTSYRHINAVRYLRCQVMIRHDLRTLRFEVSRASRQ